MDDSGIADLRLSRRSTVSAPPGIAPALQPVPASRPDCGLSVDELASRIVGLSARLAAATCRWLLLVAEFDARNGCARSGLASTAQWLSHACGIAHRTAIDHVRVSRALLAFPAMSDALGTGRISYSHARAIARLARPGEDQLVDDLIAVAENGTVGQLETLVRGLRTVDDNEADRGDEGGASGEYLRHGWASRTSHWRASARLDPERGGLVDHALKAVAAAEGLSMTDALVRMAEIATAALNHADDGPPRTLRGHENAAVVIHLDAELVPEGPSSAEESDGSAGTEAADGARQRDGCETTVSNDGGGARSRERVSGSARRARVGQPFARIGDGPGLPGRAVERLLCACRVRMAVFDGADVLDVGRTKRVVDDRTFRALLLRDVHCAFPGCRSRHKLEAHHVIHWLYGGRTSMSNLVLLCSRHHHAHHDGEFTIVRVGSRRSGRFDFRRADGRLLERHVDLARVAGADNTPVEDDYQHIADAARVSKSAGDRLDRDWALAVLADRRSVHRRLADRRPAA